MPKQRGPLDETATASALENAHALGHPMERGGFLLVVDPSNKWQQQGLEDPAGDAESLCPLMFGTSLRRADQPAT